MEIARACEVSGRHDGSEWRIGEHDAVASNQVQSKEMSDTTTIS
jgi:hypothetical protein